MATRSFIWMKKENKWEGIYCHWDGYPKYNGRILLKYYKNPRKIASLIALGDISSLAPKIGKYDPKRDFNKPDREYVKAYHRDRKESWEKVKPKNACSVKEAIQISRNFGAEYIYFWDGQKWNCFDDVYKQWIFGDNPEAKVISLKELLKNNFLSSKNYSLKSRIGMNSEITTINNFFSVLLNKKNLLNFLSALLKDFQINPKLQERFKITYDDNTHKIEGIQLYDHTQLKKILSINLSNTNFYINPEKHSILFDKQVELDSFFFLEKVIQHLQDQLKTGDIDYLQGINFYLTKMNEINKMFWLCSLDKYLVTLAIVPLVSREYPPFPEIEQILIPCDDKNKIYLFNFACNCFYMDETEVLFIFYPSDSIKSAVEQTHHMMEDMIFENLLLNSAFLK